MDPGRDNPYTAAKVYVSDTFNHHKTQSLFEKYLLTGDPHALDSARKGLDYAFRHQRADSAYNQPRGPGHQLLTLLAGYELTGESKYLERCRAIVEAAKRVQDKYEGAFTPSRGARFQFGIALEGLRSYYEVSGDESIPPMILRAMDFLMAEGVRTTNLAHACGFLFSRTGDRRYLDYGIQMISGDRVFEHPVKNTALALRSTPYFLFYLQPETEE
jgi:rhamnogalacturonyl hydrolase YesR